MMSSLWVGALCVQAFFALSQSPDNKTQIFDKAYEQALEEEKSLKLGSFLPDSKTSVLGATTKLDHTLDFVKRIHIPAIIEMYQGGDYQRAYVLLHELLRQKDVAAFPEYQNILFYFAESSFKIGHYAAARQAYQDLCLMSSERYLVVSLLRLIKLQTYLPDNQFLAEFLNQSTSVSDDVAYAYGRYLVIEGKDLNTAQGYLNRILPGSYWYYKSLYMRAVLAQNAGDVVLCEKLLNQVLRAKPSELDNKSASAESRVHELALMAYARLMTDLKQHKKSITLYSDVQENSDLVPQALYEKTWNLIALYQQEKDLVQKKYYLQQSLNTLDKLLVYDASHTVVPEAYLLRAHILIKTGKYAEASLAFNKFNERYELVRREVDRKITATQSQNQNRFLEDMANGTLVDKLLLRGVNLEDESTNIYLASDVASFLKSGMYLISDVKKNHDFLLSILNPQTAVDLFPEIKASYLKTIVAQDAVLGFVFKLYSSIYDRVVSSLPLAQKQTFIADNNRLLAIHAQFLRIAHTPQEIANRQQRLKQQAIQIGLSAHELKRDVEIMKSKLSAIENYLKQDQAQHLFELVDLQQARAFMNAQRQSIEYLEKQVTTAEQELLQMQKLSTMLTDPAREEDLIRQSYRTALWAQMKRLIDHPLWQDLSMSLAKNSMLRAEKQWSKLDQMIFDHKQQIEMAAEKKSQILRDYVLAESKNIQESEQSFTLLKEDTQKVMTHIGVNILASVRQKITDLMYESDRGVLDVSWKMKEVHSDTIQALLKDEKRLMSEINTDLSSLSQPRMQP